MIKKLTLGTVLGLVTLLFVSLKFNHTNLNQQSKDTPKTFPQTIAKASIKIERKRNLESQLTSKEVLNSDENSDSQKDSILVVGVGDMMLGTNFPDESYLPPNNGKNLLKAATPFLKSADITFGNLEGTILNSGGTVKKCNDPSVCYAFRMPEKLIDNLTTAGFNLLSIANNHVGDFGWEGRKNAPKVLKSKGFEFAGLMSCPYTVFEKDGIKYGFVAFAPNTGTIDIRNIAKAEMIVKELERLSDVVIVSFHGGAEGFEHERVTRKKETYYGENRGNVYEFSHKMIDAGADIIFGHGPHIVRAVELYKNRFIAYSLGNFCTYRRFSLVGLKGISPILQLYVDSEGRFQKGKIISMHQTPPGGPKIDAKNRAVKVIQRLTKADFPKTPLIIQNDGTILPK